MRDLERKHVSLLSRGRLSVPWGGRSATRDLNPSRLAVGVYRPYRVPLGFQSQPLYIEDFKGLDQGSISWIDNCRTACKVDDSLKVTEQRFQGEKTSVHTYE